MDAQDGNRNALEPLAMAFCNRTLSVFLSAIMACALSCRKEAAPVAEPESGMITLELHTEQGFNAKLKSSIISDEDRIYDLNVWVYSEEGKMTDSCYEEGNPLFTGSGTLQAVMLAKDAGTAVVIANAGRKLDAPRFIDSAQKIAFSYASSSAPKGVLCMGQAGFEAVGNGLRCVVNLSRVMSRLELKARVCDDVSAAGGVLGDNVRVVSVRLRNSASVLNFIPFNAASSARTSKAEAAGELSDYEFMSAEDVRVLNSGGTVMLYSLPNYSAVPYVNSPNGRSALSTYVEMTLAYDAYGASSSGESVCRFYASDAQTIGLLGGCSYSADISISENGATAIWRKDDGRICVPDAFVVGQTRTILLLQAKPAENASSYSWSLDGKSDLQSSGHFSISGSHYDASGALLGVKVKAVGEGQGTLYLKDASGDVVGSVALSSAYPDLSIADLTLDVVGEEADFSVSGFPSRELFASDADYDEYYKPLSCNAGVTGGLDGSDFLEFSVTDGKAFVSKLSWERNSLSHSWEEAVGKRFPVSMKLSGGIEIGFNATVVDTEVAALAKGTYFGEVFNISFVQDPNAEVSGKPRSLEAVLAAHVPVSLYSGTLDDAARKGWRTWIDNDTADGFISFRSEGSIRWSIPETWTKHQGGGVCNIYAGRLNPHCGEYVKEKAGWFYMTCYHPVGLDIYVEKVPGEDIIAYCFRPHDDAFSIGNVEIDYVKAYRETRPTVLERINAATGIGNGAYHYIKDYYEVNFLHNPSAGENAPFYAGSMYMSSAEANKCTFYGRGTTLYPAGAYSGAAFGGTAGGANLPVYILSPYRLADSKETNPRPVGETDLGGKHGSVIVEKWACSTKAYWEWPEDDWNYYASEHRNR